MARSLPYRWFSVLLLCGAVGVVLAAEPGSSPEKPDLSEYKTVAEAVTAKIIRTPGGGAGVPGYLGVSTALNGEGKLQVEEVALDSPAAKAGLAKGDLIAKLNETAIDNPDLFRALVLEKAPGESVKLAIVRDGKPIEHTITLTAASKPMPSGGASAPGRAILGVQLDEGKEGAKVRSVTPDGPAAKAGLKVGDLITKIDEKVLDAENKLTDILAGKRPGDVVLLEFERGDKSDEVRVTLVEERRPGRPGAGWDDRLPGIWRRNVYRLAVICVEFPDAKHNDKITSQDWEESLFSTGTYKDKNNATGQPVFGSMNDYYQEQSYGKLKIEGKVFDYVEVGKNRMDYSGTSVNKSVLLSEAMSKVLDRDGKDCLKDFDGVFFLYAGSRPRVNRGDLYWPHRASFNHGGKRWPYFICPEGGNRMQDISVFCHEFGHLLGLPDLYARPENPGSEGVGVWCAMSNQLPNGQPQHFCAWSKEQLGWIKPAVIDPTVKQKLILSPINDDPTQCFKVLVKKDGSEYFLLENRKRVGFDKGLPADGLLIWRVVQNKPILEESHGIEGPSGPRTSTSAVPFPSSANNAFTPVTVPSSRSQLGGGMPVHITNIRKLPDGRITFYIGYEFQ